MSNEFAHHLLENIASRYNEPHRHYHNREHLDNCLIALVLNSSDCNLSDHDSKLARIALFYHDAVLDPEKATNEFESATLFRADARKFGLTSHDGDWKLSASDIENISHAIMCTRHIDSEYTPGLEWQKVVCDCDLAILGAQPAVFKKYEKDVRKEYQAIPHKQYMKKRETLMKKMKNHAIWGVYWTRVFNMQFNAQAQLNLEKYA